MLALAKPKGFLRVSHYVSVDIFEGVDEELGPLLPVVSLAEFGSLGSVRHGCNAKPVLLLTQAVQQVGHTLQGGGNQWGAAFFGQWLPGGRGFTLSGAPSCNEWVE